MIALRKTSPCYNPYAIEINGKAYDLDSINVFNENGCIVHHKPWFGNNNKIPELNIEGECVKKNKINYTCKTAFIVKSDDEYKRRYSLWVPEKYLNLEAPIYERLGTSDMVFKKLKSHMYPEIEFVQVKCISTKELNDKQFRIRQLGDTLQYYVAHLDSPNTDLTLVIDELTQLNADIQKQLRILNNMTPKELYTLNEKV